MPTIKITQMPGLGGNITDATIVPVVQSLNNFTVTAANLRTFVNSTTGNITGGNITITGAAAITGNITAAYVIGNGSQLTGLPPTYGNVDVAAYLPLYTGNLNPGNVSVANVMTIGGSVSANSTISAAGNVTAANLIAGGTVTATGNITGGNLTTAGIVSSTGNLTAGNISTGAIAATGSASVTGAITGNSTISATGNITGGNLLTGGLISATGNLTAGNVSASRATFTNDVDVTGTVTAGTFVGTFSGNISGNLTVPGSNTWVIYNNAGNAGADSDFTFNQADSSVSIGGNLSVGGEITSGAITSSGTVSATLFSGDGGGLTNVDADTANTVTGAAQTAITSVGNLTGLVVSASAPGVYVATITQSSSTGAGLDVRAGNGNSTFASFRVGDSGGANTRLLIESRGTTTLTNDTIAAAGNLTVSGTASAVGNVTGGNVITAGRVTATGNVTGGNLTTSGIVSVTGNVVASNGVFSGNVTATNFIGNITGTMQGTTVSVTGNVTGGNLTTSGVVTATGNVTGGNVQTGGLISATGNITGGNVRTAGSVSATGNITGAFLFGNVSTATDVVTISGSQTITGNKTFSGTTTLQQYVETTHTAGNTGPNGSVVTPLMSNGPVQKYTATGSFVLDVPTGMTTGQSLTLIIRQDSTGGRIMTPLASYKFCQGINTLSTPANSIDMCMIFYDGTNYLATLNKGFV